VELLRNNIRRRGQKVHSVWGDQIRRGRAAHTANWEIHREIEQNRFSAGRSRRESDLGVSMEVIVKENPNHLEMVGKSFNVTGESEDWYYLDNNDVTVNIEKKYCEKVEEERAFILSLELEFLNIHMTSLLDVAKKWDRPSWREAFFVEHLEEAMKKLDKIREKHPVN